MKAKLSGESSRYITAAVLIGVIAALLLWNNPIVIWAVIGAVFILGFREALALYDLEQHAGFYALALALWATSYFVANPIESALVACMILASITAYAQRLSPRAMLPFLYPTLPFLALYSVYKDFGASHIVWLILIIALCDIGAYFGGRLFGKTPLSPTSPKKTLEGVIIGVAVSIVVGSVAGIFVLGTHFFFAIFASLIVAVCGVFGDLYESYLKRQAQVKDSGSILPGHGGILDRFDAVLFGAVGMHFLLIFFNDFACSRCMPLLNLIQ
ncbi:phosphatidate cytidylyltransferase [Helicobacter sp.]|uniref:phosphatidate cytidylyltransferase n=1 Tax=Helicobacter sp. TaxID=218 RepID=UPI00388D730F